MRNKAHNSKVHRPELWPRPWATEPSKTFVFCYDCRNFTFGKADIGYSPDRCEKVEKMTLKPTHVVEECFDYNKLNKNNDCPYYTPRLHVRVRGFVNKWLKQYIIE